MKTECKTDRLARREHSSPGGLLIYSPPYNNFFIFLSHQQCILLSRNILILSIQKFTQTNNKIRKEEINHASNPSNTNHQFDNQDNGEADVRRNLSYVLHTFSGLSSDTRNLHVLDRRVSKSRRRIRAPQYQWFSAPLLWMQCLQTKTKRRCVR